MITVVGNLKGGSGKSTVTFNIAVWLAMVGETVVAYDLDPQSTLSDVSEVRAEEGCEPSIRVYRARGDIVERLTSHQGEVIADVGALDLAGMKEALGVADRVLIPVAPSQADIWSTQRFVNIVAGVEPTQKRNREVLGFINRADTHISIRESDEAEEALAHMPNLQLLQARLAQRTAFRRSFSEGLGVFELEPGGKAAEEFGSLMSLLYPKLARTKGRRKSHAREDT